MAPFLFLFLFDTKNARNRGRLTLKSITEPSAIIQQPAAEKQPSYQI